MRLRQALFFEAQALAALEAQAQGGPAEEGRWQAWLAPDAPCICLALEKEGSVIGAAAYARHYSGLELLALAVAPGWQGRGYGRFCMRAVGRAAAGRPVHAWAPAGAAGFMERCGFAPTGRRQGCRLGFLRPGARSAAVGQVQQALTEALAGVPAPVCIDATCGNGHDTEFLARLAGAQGRVLALDIQPQAAQATRARLRAAGLYDPARHKVVRADHARLAELAARTGFAPAHCVMFNFGWLPGGDHRLYSTADTSLAALRAALGLLAPGGAVSAVLYSPGQGPQEQEKQAVLAALRALPRQQYALRSWPAPKGAPLPFLVQQRGL